MTSLRSIALGLLMVMLHVPVRGYDAVPDPVGWVLVLVGLAGLRPVLDGTGPLLGLAGLCLGVAAVTYPPGVSAGIGDSLGWAASLPQLAFVFALCTALAPRSGRTARRLRTLRWCFLALAAAPVVVLGGGVEVLRGPVALVGVLCLALLVLTLFRLPGLTELTGTTGPGGPPGQPRQQSQQGQQGQREQPTG